MNLDQHITEITRLRRQADLLPDDSPGVLMQKIELLAKCLVYIGRVSSHLDGVYKRVYARRKYEHALAITKAQKDKQAHAELAVKELREEEATAYEDMNRWRNAFSSTTEEIHSLKMRMKQDFYVEGAANVSTERRSQTPA
ncbi:hypothetical protein DNH61_11655 [Paenibacillus sambharensis]|uniref:Uncharacterized protein n=1 Tax=Paenibacillus sambharensis TaxID=1803190 RepID=A0A2W1L539_9BACL|nr:hypothetical protein [Paenibacillus sambharensis]PZD95208.1 hypothetical protein DNH61_11655 [Paenibacillus sambharensis]